MESVTLEGKPFSDSIAGNRCRFSDFSGEERQKKPQAPMNRGLRRGDKSMYPWMGGYMGELVLVVLDLVFGVDDVIVVV